MKNITIDVDAYGRTGPIKHLKGLELDVEDDFDAVSYYEAGFKKILELHDRLEDDHPDKLRSGDIGGFKIRVIHEKGKPDYVTFPQLP